MEINKAEKERIFKQFRYSLGAPLRNIETIDDQLCVILEIAIEDYAQYVQEWFIENQWSSVYGKNVTTQDISFALSVRDLSYSRDYSYAYSKQVGHQTDGPWELKKDFIEIESGRQVYQIPAGREINEVLYITPSSIDHALYGNGGVIDGGFAGGVGQVGNNFGNGSFGGNGSTGNGGHYIAPAFDTLLSAADIDLKHRLLRSELAFKITKGPNDTRLLHLLSTPGSKFNFGSLGSRTGFGLSGCKVWYHYYETTSENVEECRRENKDIIQLPNDVPLSRLEYGDFNEPTKTYIRQLFFALGKKTLGRVRGKFGGKTGIPEAEGILDYESLLNEGNEEEKALKERLDERLKRLSSESQLERASSEADNLNNVLKYIPLGIYKF